MPIMLLFLLLNRTCPACPETSGAILMWHFDLIATPAIQTELNLTGDQIGKAVPIVLELTKKRDADLHALRGGKNDPIAHEKIAIHYDELARERLETILNPQQISRLSQITLQRSGNAIFRDDRVLQALAVSAEQQEFITSRLQQARDELFRLHTTDDPFGPSPEVRSRVDEKAREDILNILIQAQRETLQSLLGDPFRPKFQTSPLPQPPLPSRHGSK